MSDLVIKVDAVSKLYKLGVITSRTIREDIRLWWKSKIKGNDSWKRELKEEDYLWALKDISFEVRRGEVLGIIGKNGAGKSTLLKIMSRVTSPTSGSIKIKGRAASLLEVGTGFHPELTGRENIFLNGAILGMSKAEIRSKLDEIIEFSGVSRFIDTPVKRYSSGMYVRLAFAVAAHLDPDILIVDEVLAVGDMEFQKKCLGKMKDVSGQGRTVLFVSHNMAIMKSLCTRGILLEKGRIKVNGSIHETIDEYFSENKEVAKTGIIPDDFYRPYGTGEARFKVAYVINQGQEKTNELRFNERFRIKMELQALQDIKGALLSVQLKNGVHETVVFSSDYRSKFTTVDFCKGNHLVEVDFNTCLMPGRYLLTANLSFFNSGSVIDTAQNVFEFTVSNLAEPGKGDYLWGTVHGYVHADTNWVYKNLN